MEKTKFTLEDFIDIREVLDIIFKGKLIIIVITLLFAVSSVLYSLSLNNIYRSSAVLTLTDDSNSGQNLASKYSGLASLAGISLGSATSDKSDWAIEKIKSRDFLLGLVNDKPKFVPALMAAGNYDKTSNSLTYNSEIYDVSNNTWLDGQPHYLDIWRSYLGKLYISKSKDNGFISISFDHISPLFAQEMVVSIIKKINDVAKENDLAESTQAMDYLLKLSPDISNATIKLSLNKVIEEQLRIQMFSNIKTNYLFKTIEPPYTPIYKLKPSRAVICIMGTLMGFILGILIVLIRRYFFTNSSV